MQHVVLTWTGLEPGGTPPAGWLVFWAGISGALSMVLFALVAPQRRIRRLKRLSARVQRKMRSYDGNFRGAMALAGRNLGLALRQLWLSIGPALLAGVPVILVTVWIVPNFEHELPAASERPAAPAEKLPDVRPVSIPQPHVGPSAFEPPAMAASPSASGLPPRQFLSWGPPWLRSATAAYFLVTACSALAAKFLLKIV